MPPRNIIVTAINIQAMCWFNKNSLPLRVKTTNRILVNRGVKVFKNNQLDTNIRLKKNS